MQSESESERQDGPIERSIEISSNLEEESPDTPHLETNEFKPKVFFEFFGYFLLAQWFGPLAYLIFIKFVKNGYVLAKNLHIYGGWAEIIRTLIWFARVYCFVVTFWLEEFHMQSQFWLVIYTDICLAVLYGAYYSSFTEREIKRLKTEVYDVGSNIIERILKLIRAESTNAFEKKIIVSRFPEIDVNNFFFVYPQKYEKVIPQELDPQPVNKNAPYLRHILVTEGLIVRGEKYASYIANKGGYEQLKYKILTVQVLSRLVVFVRVILPVVGVVYAYLNGNNDPTVNGIQNTGDFIMWIVAEVIYCYFIYRFALVYDVLFLGLILYYRKMRLLKTLKKLIDIRPSNSQKDLLKIVPTVPQNIENWLSLRKIFAGMNQQAFVVIDTNMSFSLFYALAFIGIYALLTLNLLTDMFSPVTNFLEKNAALKATIFVTLIIVVIVLIVHLILGILINMLFSVERKEWTLQSEIIRSIRINHNIYHSLRQEKTTEESGEGDEYIERVENVKSVMGSNFTDHFEAYVKKLRDSISLLLDGLDYEEIFNPHTLLGLKITPRLVVSIFTFISAVGLATINDIVSHAGN